MFEILGADYQMSTSCGQDEPHRSPKKAYFSCVIGIYIMSFFYEIPVLCLIDSNCDSYLITKVCRKDFLYFVYIGHK